MKIDLIRTYHDGSTIGELFIDGRKKSYTIERPWKDNERRVSCIPEGCYEIGLKMYGRWHEKWKDKSWYKGVLILKDTLPRTEILIHTANYAHQLNGCIAPGVSVGVEEDNIPCVWQSSKALKRIYPTIAKAIENGEDVVLNITKSKTV